MNFETRHSPHILKSTLQKGIDISAIVKHRLMPSRLKPLHLFDSRVPIQHLGDTEPHSPLVRTRPRERSEGEAQQVSQVIGRGDAP